MQTRPRIKLPDELLYELQHVAVDVAQERCIPNMRVNKLLEEIVRTFVARRRTRKVSGVAARG